MVLASGDEFEIAAQRFLFTQATSKITPAVHFDNLSARNVGDYKVLDHTIGSGAFSVVRLAFNTKVSSIPAFYDVTVA